MHVGHTIGLIGCGRWGSLILRDLLALDCRVHVVVPRAAARSAIAGAAGIYESVDQLPPVDGIVVAVPSSLHAEVVGSVVDLGVPIFVEKPFTTDVAAARHLVDRAGDRIFVMDKWRYLAGVKMLRELLASGRLGEPIGLTTVRADWGTPHTDVDAVWILAPHDLSIALEILGDVPVPESVVCSRSDHMIDLYAIGRTSRGWHHMHISDRSHRAERRIEVHGTDASAILASGWEDEVMVVRPSSDGAKLVESVAASGELPLLAELRAFLGFLDGGPPPVSSAAEGLKIVEAITAIRQMAGLP